MKVYPVTAAFKELITSGYLAERQSAAQQNVNATGRGKRLCLSVHVTQEAGPVWMDLKCNMELGLCSFSLQVTIERMILTQMLWSLDIQIIIFKYT